MSEIDQPAVGETAQRSGGRAFRMAMALVLVAVLAAAGGAFYVFFWHSHAAGGRRVGSPAAALPVFLEVKPFVVSMAGAGGNSHFVQVGVTLTLSGPALGPLIKAVLPEVKDAMRQTMLAFKADEIMTPAGVDKLRNAMTAKVNHLLLRRLGAERIKAANGGRTDAVRNIYFSTLIVE